MQTVKKEILNEDTAEFDYICCPVGTGGTISGIINASLPHQKIIGFPALKGDFLRQEITKFVTKSNWELCHDFHFGGYAKISDELIHFINDFKLKYHVPLDPIYTGKMLFGIQDLRSKGYFEKDAKILAIHTGGLQGISGMNQKLKHQYTFKEKNNYHDIDSNKFHTMCISITTKGSKRMT